MLIYTDKFFHHISDRTKRQLKEKEAESRAFQTAFNTVASALGPSTRQARREPLTVWALNETRTILRQIDSPYQARKAEPTPRAASPVAQNTNHELQSSEPAHDPLALTGRAWPTNDMITHVSKGRRDQSR
jgi:hypothetical protein